MNFFFHPEAEEEFQNAMRYYESIEFSLGYEFAVEIYLSIQRSVEFPKAWPCIEKNIRRSLANRFPYGILYSEEQEGIYIVAVMNLQKDPNYWKHRK